MKKTISLSLLGFVVLTGCGGPTKVAYHSSEFTYDSSVFESFSNDITSGIGAKGDESCWIDLTGDLTSPLDSEELQNATEGNMTLMSDSMGVPQYISFGIGNEIVYARVSVEDTDNCTGKLVALAEMNATK